MQNPLIKKMASGQVVLGLGLNFPVAGIVELIGAGWDWLWIDGQHGQHDYRTMLSCTRAADLQGLAPVVRVPGHEYGTIGLAMDMRPAGIMVPMVDDVDQARQVVEAVRFPPLGKRSYGGRRVYDVDGFAYYKTANEDVLLVAQIETPEAVQNAEAIAAVEGVDVLFFGGDAMKMRMGIPMNTPVTESDELAGALERTAKAACNADKIPGCVAATAETLALSVDYGYQFIAGASDVGFLRTASPAKLEELRGALRQ